MEELTSRLKDLETENQELKKELADLKASCILRAELEEMRQDLDRLKKSSPETLGGSPGMYSRVKGLKKNRPQSMHEVSQALQDQLAVPKMAEPSFSSAVPPVYFTLENFAHHKKNCLKWFSPSFYSHTRGYKMCIGLSAAGCSVGEGTHVSALVYFLRGEYDESLQWPFRGTVKISLLNERKNSNHFTSEIKFDEDTTYVDSGRVEGNFERTAGYGNPLYIEHGLLGYDQAKDCEYLKYDRLRFVVECVTVNV